MQSMILPYDAYIAVRIIDKHDNNMGLNTYGKPYQYKLGDRVQLLLWNSDKDEETLSVTFRLYRDVKEASDDPCIFRYQN